MKLSPWEPDLRSLVDRIDQGDIDLQPDFQRQEVWSVTKKKRLIDTVLREWSIPPLHLIARADGQLEVLDGQQRLASIRDFFHDEFAINGDITPYDERVRGLHRRHYSRLDQVDRRRVDQYTLRCFRITDYMPEEPNELFYRLNQPTMLTAGEQRNALYGPAREQLKALVNLFEELGNDRATLGFSNSRLAYDDVLARLLFFVEARNFGAKSTEARISDRFRSTDPFSHEALSRCETGIELFSSSLGQAERTKLNKASVLSWLLFYSRFDDVPEKNLIQIFIDVQRGRGSSPILGEAVALFEDRASLRVTDVSSVVYRDFCLCYLYTFAGEGARVPMVPQAPLREVRSRTERGYDYEDAVRFAVDIDTWSTAL